MRHDRDAEQQLVDGGEILSCTFATMDMLRDALAAQFGTDDGAEYGFGEPEPHNRCPRR